MLTPLTDAEREGLERTKYFNDKGTGYVAVQSTKPQTLGYSLSDSPVGLLAWIYEKLVAWTDDYPWTDDEGKVQICANVMWSVLTSIQCYNGFLYIGSPALVPRHLFEYIMKPSAADKFLPLPTSKYLVVSLSFQKKYYVTPNCES